MKDLGHGRDYRYAHDEGGGYAAGERYLPDGMDEPGWYQPVDRGLEQRIAEKMGRLRGMDAAAMEEAAARSQEVGASGASGANGDPVHAPKSPKSPEA